MRVSVLLFANHRLLHLLHNFLLQQAVRLTGLFEKTAPRPLTLAGFTCGLDHPILISCQSCSPLMCQD